MRIILLVPVLIMLFSCGNKTHEIPAYFNHVDQVLWVNEDLNNTISHWKNLGFDQIMDLDTVDAALKKSGKTIRLKVAKANLGGANITWIQTVGGESVFNQFQTLSGNGAMSLVYRLENEKAIQEEMARLAGIGINVKEEITHIDKER